MRRLKTARDVVRVLGGHDAVCSMTGANKKAAYYWTGQARRFPSRTYCKMQKELALRGATASPRLWKMIGYDRAA